MKVYFQFVMALLWPGARVSSLARVSDRIAAVGDLSHWRPDELRLLIDEGRRKFDDQSARFDRIRDTAQVVLQVGSALLVVIGSQLTRIQDDIRSSLRPPLYVLWAVAAILILLGTLGAASLLVVRAVFGAVLPSLVSQGDDERVLRDVASAYVVMMRDGEDTINTRLTLQWWTVWFLVVGGSVFLVAWSLLVL